MQNEIEWDRYVSIQLCSGCRSHLCSHRALFTASAGSQLCLPVLWGVEGRSGQGDHTRNVETGPWAAREQCSQQDQGWPRRAHHLTANMWMVSSYPCPSQGLWTSPAACQESCITFAKLRRAQPLIPSSSPHSDGCPSSSIDFFLSEVKRKAQLSAVTQIA